MDRFLSSAMIDLVVTSGRYPGPRGFAIRRVSAMFLTGADMDFETARHQFRTALEAEYTEPFPGADFKWFEENSIPQTLQFYGELMPYMHHFLARLPWGSKLNVLDAGCGSGAGADMIGRLHKSTFLGHQYDVTGIDLHDISRRRVGIRRQCRNADIGHGSTQIQEWSALMILTM